MTTHYVDSTADGENDGSDWDNAWTSLSSATGVAAGDTVLIDDGHSETYSTATTLNFSSGTRLAPVRVISVDKSDNSPSAGATIKSDSSVDVTLTGATWVWGLTFDMETSGGDDFYYGPGNDKTLVMENCIIKCDRLLAVSTDNALIIFRDCTIDTSSNSTSEMQLGASDSEVWFINCDFSGCDGSPGVFLDLTASEATVWTFQDCDITGSGCSTVINAVDGENHRVVFRRCCFKAGATLLGTAIADPRNRILFESCSSGTITDPVLGLTELHEYWGTVKSDLTRYRTGGADDGEQANAYSWEMDTTANSAEVFLPLRSLPRTIWVDPDASISSATAQGIFTSTRMDPQGTPSALTTDGSSTWNGTDVGTKQKITHTLTNGDTLTVYVASGGTLNDDDFWVEISEPDQVGGPVSVVFCLAKASTTVYVDPKLEVA